MKDWRTLQHEVAAWANFNFGKQGATPCVLGLMEEVGEFMAARVVYTNHENQSESVTEMIDALGDQVVYILNLCDEVGLPFADLVSQAEGIEDYELMGCIALAARAVLKHSQGIRGYDDAKRRHELQVSLTVWFQWALHQCDKYFLPSLLMIANNVWSEVQARDWRKNPTDAHAVVRDDLAAGK